MRTIDDDLRKRVRTQLEKLGWDQKKLAAELDVAEATITNLLKPGPPKQIKYLPALLETLGLEDDLELVQRNWPNLPPEIRAAIVAIVSTKSGAK